MGGGGLIKQRKRKCRADGCRNQFIPERPFIVWCSDECGTKIALKKLGRAKVLQEARRKRQATQERRDTRERKEKLKARRDYVKEAQIAWNRYIRIRDYGRACASCGSMPEQRVGGSMDCSHYRSVGSAPHLRFNVFNAALACVKCNRYLAGNVVELRKALVIRFGIDRVEALESNNETRKFDVAYLKRLKSIFTVRANRLANLRGIT